jgi:hypothetical protein
MIVETKAASIDTMAVTIQALHVSGKQMTLAVFRQLPIMREGAEAVPWGIVRYAIKDEGDLWLVFSDDGRLYRRALDLSFPWISKSAIHDAEKKLQQAVNGLQHRQRLGMATDRWEKDVEEAQEWLVRARQDYDEETAWGIDRFRAESRLAELPQLFIAV